MSSLSPRYSEADLEEILVSREQIASRIKEIAKEISIVFGNNDLTVVSVLSGSLIFTADLFRHLEMPLRLDCLRAESYGAHAESQGMPRIETALKNDIANRHVLIVDDILDTGRTLKSIVAHLSAANPASIRTCVLLDKKERRKVEIEADFVGFDIPNAFVVGYGLDFAERYRNLRCIGALKPEFQNPEQH